MDLEQALARLERALLDLTESRGRLGESLDQAIDKSLKCVEDLERAVARPKGLAAA